MTTHGEITTLGTDTWMAKQSSTRNAGPLKTKKRLAAPLRGERMALTHDGQTIKHADR